MRVFIQRTPPLIAGVPWGGGPPKFGGEILKLVVGAENFREVDEIRKKIKRYYTTLQIDSRGHTFLFDRPDDKTYFKVDREEPTNWVHQTKPLQLPAGSQGIYGFWFKGQTEIFEDITGDGNLVHQLLNQLHSSYEPLLVPIGQDKDQKTVPFCAMHEVGQTPILGWYICKKCGINMKKAGMQK